MVNASGIGEKTELLVTNGQVRTVLAAADTVLAASGTVTLEAALMQRPMVIAYRMSPASYQIMRRMGYLPYVGLPNILCDDWVVPEYIQAAATPRALGNALLEQLDDEPARERIVQRFADLHAQLAINCADRCTEVISRYVAN
jgi:lipid-A-disaccharide synthase